jgi:hypothetical protein
MGSRTRFPGAIFVALFVVVLSACGPTQNYNAPIALRLDAGNVNLAVCTGGQIEEIRVDQRQLKSAGDWTIVWRAAGTATFSKGEVFVVGLAPEGLETNVSGKFESAPGWQTYVRVIRSPGANGDSVLGVFPEFKDGSLTEDMWLQTNGSHTAKACSK